MRSTGRVFFAVLGVLRASTVLDLDGNAADLRRWLAIIALTLQIGLWAQRAVRLWLDSAGTPEETDPGAITTFQGLSYLVRGALWVAVAVFILDNLGYNVSALLAGLGIGGVAVALAMQNVLGDLFASLSIALDKPFVTGDFIIVDDKMGTVSRVGLKTTRVTSLSGEQLVFSNSDLLSSRIRNYKRMQERRVAFSFGVLYQTTTDQLESIPRMVRNVIEETPETRFDRAHFKEFGDSSYVFEVVYYVLDPDYNRLHGLPAVHQPRYLPAIRRERHRVRLPDPDAPPRVAYGTGWSAMRLRCRRRVVGKQHRRREHHDLRQLPSIRKRADPTVARADRGAPVQWPIDGLRGDDRGDRPGYLRRESRISFCRIQQFRCTGSTSPWRTA